MFNMDASSEPRRRGARASSSEGVSGTVAVSSSSSSSLTIQSSTQTDIIDMGKTSGFFSGSSLDQRSVLPVSSTDTSAATPSHPTRASSLFYHQYWTWHKHLTKRVLNISSLIALILIGCVVLGTTCAFTTDRQFHLITVGVPFPCHSHNDYWRRRPLFDALEAGCTGVEADVWLRNDDLYVSHHMHETARTPTFTQLYINPLVNILERRNIGEPDVPNGVFSRYPEQTLVLLVDFKEGGQDVFDKVHEQLQPLRERGWLSFYSDGEVNMRPITAVLTGEATLSHVLSNTTYRDVFLDAPALALDSDGSHIYNYTNSYYASAKFGAAFGPFAGYLTKPDGIEKFTEAAHGRGLKMRFWSQPAFPRAARNRLWGELLDEGVDILNVDELEDVNRFMAGKGGRVEGVVMGEMGGETRGHEAILLVSLD